MAFECWACGACCRFVRFMAPELDRGDGACKHLQDDNLCGIYEDRPDFCHLPDKRTEEEQTKWCKLQELNWKKYQKSMQALNDIGIAVVGVDRPHASVIHSEDDGTSDG